MEPTTHDTQGNDARTGGAPRAAPAAGRAGAGARGGVVLACVAALAAALPSPAAGAHEIPGDITVHAFVKPEGGRLRLLLRVPLAAMRDVEFPLRGPGYLDISRADQALRDAAMLWIGDYVRLYEGDAPLEEKRLVAARASIPSDRSFGRYEDALALTTGPRLPDATELYWEQAMLDLLLEYPVASDRSDFSIQPRLEGLALQVVTVLRFLPPGGAERVYQYAGDPGLVRLDPRWHQAALRFAALGFSHILDGVDHLLFLLCLVLPFRRLRPLVGIVTAFTVAHSITLIASASGLAPRGLWFVPFVETLIAASIVYMALENIAGAKVRRRWVIAFGFGLVHGFGFSFALSQNLQFAGGHLATSLLAFNVGVELGQLLVLAIMVPVVEWAFRLFFRERITTIIVSALVGHTAWHWMTDRAAVLRQYRMPTPDATLLLDVLRWSALLALVGAAGWFALKKVRPLLGARPVAEAAE